MFSLFQEKPPEESDSETTSSQEGKRWRAMAQRLRTLGGRAKELLRPLISDARHWNRSTVVLAVALLAALIFGIHEQRAAARLRAPRGQAQPSPAVQPPPQQPRSREEERLAAQISALNAKLEAMAQARSAAPPQGSPDRAGFARGGVEAPGSPDRAGSARTRAGAPDKPSPTHARASRAPVSDVTIIHRVPQQPKPDPRWQKVQEQLDAQGKQIDVQGKQIESTRQAVASARTDLEGSIARTHEDLVALQRKGERNYYEFSLDKSKNFRTIGPLGVSLRKANNKDQYADLKLIVDDREVSKKHLSLYEPVMFYRSGERQPVELVINSISRDNVRGYISAARYNASDRQIGSTTTSVPGSAAETGAPRQKLVTSPR